jgi:hypothetical protein
METNETRKEKYNKMILRDKKITKKKKPNVTLTFLEESGETPCPKMLELFGDPHVSTEGTLESAHEHRNCFKRERRAKQREQPSLRNDALQLFGDGDASAEGTSESAHERCNRLQREQHAKQREHPLLRNDALQLFGDEDASAPERWDCGEMDIICGFYSAKMWIKERSANSTNNNPQFSLCCKNGKVLLPNLPATPVELEVLLTNNESSAVKFRNQIRMYNSVLAFNSLSAKVDESVTGGPGPYSFRIQGELYHRSDPYVLFKDNGHSLHNCTFMIWNANIKTGMLLCPRLIQRRWIGCWA